VFLLNKNEIDCLRKRLFDEDGDMKEVEEDMSKDEEE
jgi:hypothetical protein